MASERRSGVRRLGFQQLEARWMLSATVEDGSSIEVPAPPPVPDFSLVDVNPNSSTYQISVSPRQFMGQVSVWYFAHST